MGHTWGIPGPLFLVMYGIGLVLALGWALRVRYLVRRPEAPAYTPKVGMAELAFLAGGPRRVVEAAIAQLVETGQIHAARNGRLTAANTASSDDRVQAAVLDHIGPTTSTAESVVRDVSTSTAVAAIGDRLVEQRLLVAPAQATAARRRAVYGLVAVGVIGLLRSGEGTSQDRPVGYLLILLVLTGLLVFVLLKRRIKARTVHGDQVLASARGKRVKEPNRRLDSTAAVAGVGGIVALGGLMAFPDADMRSALMPDGASAWLSASTGSWSYAGSNGYSSYVASSGSSGSSGSGSGSGSSCSSGSSCGGGGCGG